MVDSIIQMKSGPNNWCNDIWFESRFGWGTLVGRSYDSAQSSSDTVAYGFHQMQILNLSCSLVREWQKRDGSSAAKLFNW